MIVRAPDQLPLLVRARREELGISQTTLADLTGVHRSFISMFERGVRPGSFDLVLKLVQALGMDLEVRPRAQ